MLDSNLRFTLHEATLCLTHLGLVRAAPSSFVSTVCSKVGLAVTIAELDEELVCDWRKQVCGLVAAQVSLVPSLRSHSTVGGVGLT